MVDLVLAERAVRAECQAGLVVDKAKATGNQWFWTYEYPDEDIFFESYMIGYNMGNLNSEIEADLVEAGYSADEFRLATDTSVVVPMGATVVMTVTSQKAKYRTWTPPHWFCRITISDCQWPLQYCVSGGS